MSTVTALPHSRPFSRDDLESMPDDGHRYEVIDGTLIVTPAPSYQHQGAVGELYLLLRRTCPSHLAVLTAPFAVALAPDTEIQPDLVVAPRTHFTARELPTAPLLAVEVLSPSTRRIDLTLKRSRLEAAGCACYWVLDPLAAELTAWELVDGAYVEVAHLRGDETWTTARPYPLTVSAKTLSSYL